jgi:LysR family glycine cleavage system transcriptional activator
MQDYSQISLNAVRVFAVTARHLSISAAASELNVTPGAVSHQIKKLEAGLETSLFVRSNNSIELTHLGECFYTEVNAGLHIIDRSIEELSRDVNQISLKVSVSFAVRWLIPALEDFKKKFQLARVQVTTFNQSDMSPVHDADLAICYKRVNNLAEHGNIVLQDFSRPVISPVLLTKYDYRSRADISNIPALTCTPDNWDWLFWEREMGVDSGCIEYTHAFDTDDTAIHAAVAGLGMVLATPLATQVELDTGTLVELPYFEPLLTGYYCLVAGRRKTRIIEQFQDWLIASLSDKE